MNIKITSKVAKARHSQECKEFLAYLRKSNTKSKDIPEKDFVYSYSWGERIEGDTFDDIMNGKATARQVAERAKSVEDKIAERIERSSVALIIKAGRVSKSYPIAGYSGAMISRGVALPVEVVVEIQKQERDRAAEQQRIDSLSPEQRDAEINEALAYLQGQPGFVAFGIKR